MHTMQCTVPELLNQIEKVGRTKILQIVGFLLEEENKLEMYSEILPPLPTKTFWLFLGYKSRGKEVRVYCEVVIAQEGRIASYNFYNDDFLFLFIFGTIYHCYQRIDLPVKKGPLLIYGYNAHLLYFFKQYIPMLFR